MGTLVLATQGVDAAVPHGEVHTRAPDTVGVLTLSLVRSCIVDGYVVERVARSLHLHRAPTAVPSVDEQRDLTVLDGVVARAVVTFRVGGIEGEEDARVQAVAYQEVVDGVVASTTPEVDALTQRGTDHRQVGDGVVLPADVDLPTGVAHATRRFTDDMDAGEVDVVI